MGEEDYRKSANKNTTGYNFLDNILTNHDFLSINKQKEEREKKRNVIQQKKKKLPFLV